jgi:hypothetical protein
LVQILLRNRQNTKPAILNFAAMLDFEKVVPLKVDNSYTALNKTTERKKVIKQPRFCTSVAMLVFEKYCSAKLTISKQNG